MINTFQMSNVGETKIGNESRIVGRNIECGKDSGELKAEEQQVL